MATDEVRVVSVDGYGRDFLALTLSTGQIAAMHWGRVRYLDFNGFFVATRREYAVRTTVIDYVTKHRTELLVKRRLAMGVADDD